MCPVLQLLWPQSMRLSKMLPSLSVAFSISITQSVSLIYWSVISSQQRQFFDNFWQIPYTPDFLIFFYRQFGLIYLSLYSLRSMSYIFNNSSWLSLFSDSLLEQLHNVIVKLWPLNLDFLGSNSTQPLISSLNFGK